MRRGLAVLLLPVLCLGCINFRYPAPANDPLTAGVEVAQVADNQTLVLEDGRRLRLECWVADLEALILESDDMVEVGASHLDSDGREVTEVFVKRSTSNYCGSPYTGLIRIRLIPDRIIEYERVSLRLYGAK
jgi:hypothetical protein